MNYNILQPNVNKFKLILFFFELSLKRKKIWNKKLNLNLNFIVKSFYKNEEFKLIDNLSKINYNLLYKFSNNLFKIYYLYKLLYFYIVRDYINFNNIKDVNKKYMFFYSKKSFSDSKLLYKNYNFLKNYNSNRFNKLNRNYIITIYFYFIYFIYLLNLKLLNNNNFRVSKLPNKNKKFTLLRSPHIDKRSREQFEIITHKSLISGFNLLGNNTIDFINKKTNNLYIEIIY